MSVAHGLWDALKQTYEDTVEDDIYVQDVPPEDDPHNEEDWEKGIPPFVKKLTKMVGENKSIIFLKFPHSQQYKFPVLRIHLNAHDPANTHSLGQWRALS